MILPHDINEGDGAVAPATTCSAAESAARKDIALTLPPQLIERAKSVCELGGWSVSSVVEKALTNYLNALDREIGRKCAEILTENVGSDPQT